MKCGPRVLIQEGEALPQGSSTFWGWRVGAVPEGYSTYGHLPLLPPLSTPISVSLRNFPYP